MTSALSVDLVRHAILLALMISAPLLLTALVVGLLVSLVQAVTQLQEQTLSFIPKVLCVVAMFLLLLPWMQQQLVEYVAGAIRTLPTLAR